MSPSVYDVQITPMLNWWNVPIEGHTPSRLGFEHTLTSVKDLSPEEFHEILSMRSVVNALLMMWSFVAIALTAMFVLLLNNR